MVEADVLRLNEVFNNLITNAVKYSKKNGGKITIDADEGKENVTVSIQDAGIGMTKQQISHIFDEFYKADESRHELDSSGLGLSIAKKIINKHGGRIWAESPGPGKGTTFFFTLKKHPEESIDAKSEEIIQNA
jgi:signal transduction histidine kinase